MRPPRAAGSRLAASALSAAALLSGACASGDLPLALPTSDLETVRLWGARDRQVVVVAPFEDGRDVRDRCGLWKNALGMDAADVVCEGDPAAWIAALFAERLRAAGLAVMGETDAPRPRALRIEGTLLKLFVEPVGGTLAGSVEADLSVALHASTGTGLVAERTFFVKGWRAGPVVSTREPFQESLERATEALLDEMIVAVVELLNRYRLGAGPRPARLLARRPDGRSP